ncbi:MAG: triple tyrosine motif-containing protein [Planctomycetota bacterium]
MRWLFFLALTLALLAHLVGHIPLAEATPRHKTRLTGIKQIIQPSSYNFELELILEYKKRILKYAPLIGKTVYFYLAESSTDSTKQLLCTAITDKDGSAKLVKYIPPLGVLVKITAHFEGDLDFAPCEFLIKLKRLNVLPTVQISTIQMNNRQAKMMWEGNDIDGKIQAYRYQLDRSFQIDPWSDWTQNTSSSYSDLKPGKYTFRVQAKDDFNGLSEYTNQTFQIEEKIIQVVVTDATGNKPPFTLAKNTPLALQSFLEENSIRKPLSANWHCYQGKYEAGSYLCPVGGIEDLLIVEDSTSGKITFFKIKVESE